jgi:drug/metabolite transporter (DMT)-like permease
MNFSTKQKAYFSLTLTCLSWGTTWVASKIAVQATPGLQVSGIRQFIAGSLFLLFFGLFKKEKLPTLQQFRWLLTASFFLVVINSGLTTWSVKYIPSGLAALIGALNPLFVVIIEMVFFKNKSYTLFTFIGLFTGILGIAIVFYNNAFHHHPDGYVFGLIICFIGILSWSIGTLLVARNKYQMNPYYALGWQMFIASFLLMIFAKATHNTIPIQTIPLKTWLSILYLIAVGSIVAFVAFLYSIKHLPSAIASLYSYINPVIAMVIGAIIFSEKLTGFILIGTVITLVGVYIVNMSLRKR